MAWLLITGGGMTGGTYPALLYPMPYPATGVGGGDRSSSSIGYAV